MGAKVAHATASPNYCTFVFYPSNSCISISTMLVKKIPFFLPHLIIHLPHCPIKNLVTTTDCTGNLNTLVECEKGCKGKMNCPNKRIQTGLWKKVETKETQGSGNGLFAMDVVIKGDYIIEYVG